MLQHILKIITACYTPYCEWCMDYGAIYWPPKKQEFLYICFVVCDNLERRLCQYRHDFDDENDECQRVYPNLDPACNYFRSQYVTLPE